MDTPFPPIKSEEERVKDAIDAIHVVGAIDTIESADDAARLLDYAERVLKAAKDASTLIKSALIKWANDNKIKSADIGNDMRLIFSTTPKYEISLKTIYERYNIPAGFVELLSSSAIKIGAVKASNELSKIIPGCIDVSDCYAEIEQETKVELKPQLVNKRFLK